MGFRFRKSIRIMPGVRVNVGSKGITSVSVGRRGASVSVGKRGVYQNLGIPGTGISYRQRLDVPIQVAGTPPRPKRRGVVLPFFGFYFLFAIIAQFLFGGLNGGILTGSMVLAGAAVWYRHRSFDRNHQVRVSRDETAAAPPLASPQGIELPTIECSCEEFQRGRGELALTDGGTICDHLSSAVGASAAAEPPEELVALLRSRASGYEKYRKESYRVAVLPSGSIIGLGYSPTSEWVDVFARTARKGERAGECTGDFSEYGFSITGRRWSHGSGPRGATEIRALLDDLFPLHAQELLGA